MWTMLAFAASATLAPAQAGDLKIVNERFTYGVFGPVRPTDKFIPEDLVAVTFDIDGLTVDPGGKIVYKMAMEILEGTKTVYRMDAPQDRELYNSLGGSKVPAFAYWHIPAETKPGAYTFNITVTDQASKNKATVKRSLKFTVEPKAFGLVALHATYDLKRETPAPFTGFAGQTYFINFAVVGFGRDSKKNPDVDVTMTILENGKKTLEKPFNGQVKEAPANEDMVPLQFMCALNRPGTFVVELEAKDKVTNRTSKLTFPLKVLDSRMEK